MLLLVACWAFAEALLLFIVADVPISAMGLRHGRKRALWAALVAATFAALGGLAMLLWAAGDPAGSRAVLESLPGISPALVNQASAAWHEGGTMAMLLGSFSGVPYKIYAHAAGIESAGMAGFFIASIIARLPRFLLVAAVFGTLGPALRRRFPMPLLWVLFGIGWSAFYTFYFLAMGG